jgi:hypothetical protein
MQDSKYTMKERTMLLLFLVYCFNSLVRSNTHVVYNTHLYNLLYYLHSRRLI